MNSSGQPLGRRTRMTFSQAYRMAKRASGYAGYLMSGFHEGLGDELHGMGQAASGSWGAGRPPGARQGRPEVPEMRPISRQEADARFGKARSQYGDPDSKSMMDRVKDIGTGAIKAGIRHGLPAVADALFVKLPNTAVAPVAAAADSLTGNKYDIQGSVNKWMQGKRPTPDRTPLDAVGLGVNPVARAVNAANAAIQAPVNNNPEIFRDRTGLQKPVESVSGMALDTMAAMATPDVVRSAVSGGHATQAVRPAGLEWANATGFLPADKGAVASQLASNMGNDYAATVN